MDNATRLRLLRALIGAGGTTRWTPEQLAERSGLPFTMVVRGVETLASETPPIAWFDRDVSTGQLLAWLTPHGLEALEDLEREER